MTSSFAVQLYLVLALRTEYRVRYCLFLLLFNLTDRFIAEFSVADIKEIEWSESLLSCLSIPNNRRDIIMALAESHIGEAESVQFDDFVAGKGQGLTLLLQ